MNRKEITKRYRKVSWGRLYWKVNNPDMRRFDSDDVCIVKNGTLTTHYKTVDALIEQIEAEEEWQAADAELEHHHDMMADAASY